jgi:diadenosine tetraphosphatase ApaH/serine/threonine PP2A family protein phosphatase
MRGLVGGGIRRGAVRQLRSVGKPKDGHPRASFALLDLAEGEVAVTIERVEYDAESVARAVAESGLPVEYAEKLAMAA